MHLPYSDVCNTSDPYYDCWAFSPNHYLCHGCGCMLLFSVSSHPRWWVLFTICPMQWCVHVSDPCYWFPCLFPRYWKCMEHIRKWVLHTHICLKHCDVVVFILCVAVLSFLLPQPVSPMHSYHAPVVCAVSVILAIDCCVLSPHSWECMEYIRKWVAIYCTPTSAIETLWGGCGCNVLLFSPSSHPGGESHSFTSCSNDVCSTISDPWQWHCVSSSLFLEHMEHTRWCVVHLQ